MIVSKNPPHPNTVKVAVASKVIKIQDNVVSRFKIPETKNSTLKDPKFLLLSNISGYINKSLFLSYIA